jgi:hypothetical protein
VIILSGVLVVVAIALLVTGIVTGNTGHEVAGLDGLKLIYVSIGVSIISALCLAIGVFLRRKELFGTAEPTASAKRSAASRSGRAARPAKAKAKARVGAGDDGPTVPVTPATAVEVPAETSVYVVPGRKRYHLETCRQLAGRDKEELTFVEAREEGFTACTACLPDMALAARAASESTDKPADATMRTSPETGRTDDEPATATRIDLPVTRLDSDTAELEPAAESPTAIPPDDGVRDPDVADTARLDQIAETTEAAPEPPVERPSARSRSFFEPLDRGETVRAEDSDTAETADTTTADAGEEEPATADVGDEHPGEDDAARPEPVETEETGSAARDEAEPAEEPVDEEPADEEPEPAEFSATREPAAQAEEREEPAAQAGRDGTEADGEAGDEAGDEEGADESAPEPETEPADQPKVRILSGTKRYHRSDCALIEDIADDADDLENLTQAEAKDRGCTPCLVCQPDKDLADE